MSLPQLLATAHGQTCAGAHQCVFCAAPADMPHILSESFTTRDVLRRPGSGFVCRGCLFCLEEAGDATYHTGEVYRFTKAFRRMCSWIVTEASCTAATKGHLDYLRRACVDPPVPPFGISLAVSGQKHVLFRGVVCYSHEAVTVTLEGERIDYRPADLSRRLDLCGRIVAATGKPALDGPPNYSLWFRVCERYADGEAYCAEWERVREEPLSRLAAFLSPKKEIADRDYPGDRPDGVPPPRGGAGRPDPSDRRGRGSQRQGGSEATLFGAV